MNQEFRRRLVKQMPVFLQTWNIFVLWRTANTLTDTSKSGKNAVTFSVSNLYFSPVFGGNEFISHNAALAWGEALPGITQY